MNLNLLGYPDIADDIAKLLDAKVVRHGKRPALGRAGVVIEVWESGTDDFPSMTWRAQLPPPGTPKFRIYPEGFKSFMTKAFGAQDVEIGHSSFDLAFMVKASSPELMKQLWTPDLCNSLVTMRDVSIDSDGHEVVLVKRSAMSDTPIDPITGFELLFALGAVDLYGRDVLRALPEAQYDAALGEVAVPGPCDIRFGFIRTDEHVATCVRATVENLTDVPAKTRARLERLGVAIEITSASTVVAAFPDVERDPSRLLAVADALRELGPDATRQGVFR